MLHLEITEVVIVHCNIVNKGYSRILYIFVPNKSFGQLLDILRLIQNFHILKYGLLIKF